MSDLKGKKALVTAGSRGLGAEIVIQLAELGADVAFTYKENENGAIKTAEHVESRERRSLPIRADVSDFTLAEQVTEKVIDELGGLDILVCNAGIASPAPISRMTESDWDIVMNVSLKGAFNYIHGAIPHFTENKAGKIVCIGSINGLRGRIGGASYNVAKAGLAGLVKTAANELGPQNINVNLVAPGFIETPSQEKTPELIRDLIIKECAIKRLGTPADIAAVVTFLCSDNARHVTGQVIKVDAGQYI